MRGALSALGLLIGAFGLIAQVIVTVPAYMQLGHSLPAAIFYYLSFFTILTNIAVVLVYAADLSGRPAFFLRDSVRNGVAMTIAVVGIVYYVVLAALWQPQGLHYLADVALHYVAPVFYVIWWLSVGRNGSARWSNLPAWLAFPFFYLFYALIRGATNGEYLYPFLDLSVKSLPSVAVSVGVVVCLFAIVGALVIIVDRLLPIPSRKS